MSQDRVDILLNSAKDKAQVKFKEACNQSYEVDMLAVQNVLLAELIEVLRVRLPKNVTK